MPTEVSHYHEKPVWFIHKVELAGIHKKGKENKNADTLSRSTHTAEVYLLEEDKYAEFYEKDKPGFKFKGRGNEIQHIQHSLIKIAEEHTKD